MRVKDIIYGRKYNLLTPKYAILKETDSGKKRTFIVCDCECGNKDVYVAAYNFGRNLSCGCSHNQQRKNKRKLQFKYKIGDMIISNDENISIVARKVIHINGQYKKYYKIRCSKCGFDSRNGCYVNEGYTNEYWIQEREKMTCPCCSSHKVVQFGVNSIYDTDYWMVKYFKDKEIPKKITRYSSKRKEVICPFCKKKKMKCVSDIYRNKSIGCVCSQVGKSFFERYFSDICNQLSEQYGYVYDSEITPDWCVFSDFNNTTLRKGRYDFQPDKNRKIYVELDGDFHRQNNRMNGQSVEESLYIDKQKDLLANQNGYIVIRIVCDNKKNLQDRILNSALSLYFDFSNIDFDRAFEFAQTKIFNDICDDKNKGLTIKQISNKYKISDSTVRRKVKDGVKLGKCNYDPYKENLEVFRRTGKENWKHIKNVVGQCNKKSVEISKDKNVWERYDSMVDLISISQERYGYKFLHSGISRVCNGIRETYYGYYFRFSS